MHAPLNFAAMAHRDPAMAALVGAIPGYDFGYSEPRYAESRYIAPSVGFGDEYGDDDYGYAGDEYGFGLGSAFDPSMNVGFGLVKSGVRRPVRRPAPRPMGRSIAGVSDPTSTVARTMLLDPNRNSAVKVERYSFSWSPTSNLTLGTASSLSTFTQQPSASIKGQRLLMNAPAYGFVTVDTLQIANVNVLIGGTEDAYTYSANAQGVMLDLPRLDPQNRATCSADYTGLLPVGYTAAAEYKFIVTLQGPAVLAGGYGQ